MAIIDLVSPIVFSDTMLASINKLDISLRFNKYQSGVVLFTQNRLVAFSKGIKSLLGNHAIKGNQVWLSTGKCT